jgi:hypothetical protein
MKSHTNTQTNLEQELILSEIELQLLKSKASKISSSYITGSGMSVLWIFQDLKLDKLTHSWFNDENLNIWNMIIDKYCQKSVGKKPFSGSTKIPKLDNKNFLEFLDFLINAKILDETTKMIQDIKKKIQWTLEKTPTA